MIKDPILLNEIEISKNLNYILKRVMVIFPVKLIIIEVKYENTTKLVHKIDTKIFASFTDMQVFEVQPSSSSSYHVTMTTF